MARRRASEGMIGVNMQVLFDERVKDIQKSVLEKAKLLAANPGTDQPILRERLYASMIWGDYNFLGNFDVEIVSSEESKMILIEDTIQDQSSVIKSALSASGYKRKIKKKFEMEVLKVDDDFMDLIGDDGKT